MRRKKCIKIFFFVLIAFIVLGVGYAAINNINLIINGTGSVTATQENFLVKFLDVDGHRPSIMLGSSNTVSVIDNTTASFDVSTLSKKGDTAVATIDVKNESNGVGARIGLNLTNSNDTYFKVTEHIVDTELQAGDITTVTVTIEMLKTPIDNDEVTSITATLTANPIENSSATGSDSAIEVVPGPISFATDSWKIIKDAVHNNNTSLYHVGDTKEVLINGNYYTLRIANKETGTHCGDSDTAYSQTACGFVVEFVDIVTIMQMRNTNANDGGYPQTYVFSYLKNTLFGQLPSDLQSVIEPTRVISGYGSNGVDSNNITSVDQRLYLLSAEEIWGIDAAGNNFLDTSAGLSHQLEYYRNNSVTYNSANLSGTNYTLAKKQYNSSDYWWWLRSANSNSCASFAIVGTLGNFDSDIAYGNMGVAPAFRIA